MMTKVALFTTVVSSLIIPHLCFSFPSDSKITSLVRNGGDATTPYLLGEVLTDHIVSDDSGIAIPVSRCSVATKSDFHQFRTDRENVDLSLEGYEEYACSRHKDCLELFDRYESVNLRCERISSSRTENTLVEEFNMRWQASWVSAGSVWLFDLADAAGWEIERKIPDSSQVSTFSWTNVGRVFTKAFSTGKITLPTNLIEGTTCTRLRVKYKDDNSKSMKAKDTIINISVSESIDLVREADLGRLQNRIVAQELASWLDVSRRPIYMDGNEDEWASHVRGRILNGVPGAGPLDVDPNEDSPSVIVLFGVIVVAAFVGLYNLLLEEVVGGTGEVSKLCDDAAKLEIGSGYFSECFGPYGDGPFL